MLKEYLPLSTEKGKLYIINDRVRQNALDLEEFLAGNTYMNSRQFSENVLFSQEIKTNNTIEGYKDDIGIVCDVVSKNLKIYDEDKVQRIRNMYKGYKYIFDSKPINKETLRDLYRILSKNLLEKCDIEKMGEYYRENPVYIFFSSSIYVEPDQGVDYNEIEEYMNEFFDYVNQENIGSSLTDHFIKSQVMHFQFVNIHPYFDINGRTSRTTAMWYLLNHEAYPYIIFNRGITLNKSDYYKVIRDVKKIRNVTFFINYMLGNVRLELEKEYIIEMIRSQVTDLSILEYQTLLYILSMNQLLTVKDFASFYNRNNDKKQILEIYKSMLEPLLDKRIILKGRNTSTNFDSEQPNFIFKLNDSMYENDPSKIKRLKI